MSNFMSFLGDIDDMVGDDDLAYLEGDELGAARHLMRHGHHGAVRHAHQRHVSRRQARAAAVATELRDNAGMTGLPARQPVIEPLGFTVVTFTAASGTTLQATATPQKPMKGSRLVIDQVRSATATGLVTLASLKIGTREVLISAQPVPAGMFAPGAFGVALRMVEAHPGIIITATFVISAAPVMAETVTVSTGLNALSME